MAEILCKLLSPFTRYENSKNPTLVRLEMIGEAEVFKRHFKNSRYSLIQTIVDVIARARSFL
jgi:hypothetical protein